MKRFRRGIILSILAGLLILGATVNAGAQARLEANLNWPLSVGIGSSSSYSTGNFNISEWHLLVPDFRAYYQFGDDFLRGGIGVRVPTLLVVSLIYPEAFVELNLHPVVLEASLGGFLFGAFGVGVGSFTFQPFALPDLNASLALTDWFRIGAGVLFLMPFDGSWNQNYLYAVYVGARFVFVVK